ncbi:major facilitator superfamily protein [Hirsutella rhossiliensis]|uniref:Major facilitator superfamily domain-containing protein n=1 Tax=Hirsutella rhossiliensis TaxID=111463 RepID=A0A9P8N6C6_9HYPO|nr:major facilitator superfamily domain-containing protein [Hirsutella rhossiliensis]KAH0965472.1 major facilitator superfamily domain-containing protein [Hirsutella rhossiliensis]
MASNQGARSGWSMPDTFGGGRRPKSRSTISGYLASRFSTLKPPMDKVINPITAMKMLNREQWTFFLRDLQCAWFGWILDSFDFFTVSLTLTPLANYFDKSNSEITWGIALVLMLRPVGSVIFGVWSDRWGRKWPFVLNCLLFIVLELGTGFCKTYNQFLAARALFGIAMGGLYGNAAATALEDCPDAARGIMSGLYQGGYPLGYLLATAFARALVNTTRHGWRPLFWFSAGPPVLLIIWRLCLPETRAFRERQLLRRSAPAAKTNFLDQAGKSVKNYWLTLIYMIVLMAGFTYMSHGSQDLYPTLLTDQFEFSENQVTITQVVGNLGGFIGAVCVGNLSEIFGRRLTIIASCLLAGALLYPYTFVSTPAITAVAFFVQFATQGAFGVIPSHLLELSPPEFRSLVVGTAYQLGSLASSASATIQSSIGEKHFPLSPGPNGKKRYNYGIVICAVLGAAIVLVIVTVFLGPEKKGKQFSTATRLEEPEQSPKSESMLDQKEAV